MLARIKFPLALLLIALSGAAAICLRRTQSVGAKGVLLCDGKPIAGVKVKIYEKDTIKDDFIAETKTDKQGRFELEGTACELTTIDPKINIYHRCNNGGLRICARKFSVTIPDKYVSSGSKPKTYYDMGRHELGGRVSGEKGDCIN